MEVKAGDYFISDEKELFRIIVKHCDNIRGNFYDIKSLKSIEIVDTYSTQKIHTIIRGVPEETLISTGKVIPEKNFNNTLELLYS